MSDLSTHDNNEPSIANQGSSPSISTPNSSTSDTSSNLGGKSSYSISQSDSDGRSATTITFNEGDEVIVPKSQSERVNSPNPDSEQGRNDETPPATDLSESPSSRSQATGPDHENNRLDGKSIDGRYMEIKEYLDSASTADKAGDAERAQRYREKAMEVFHQIQDDRSTISVGILTGSLAVPIGAALGASAGVAFSSTWAGELILGFLAKRSVQLSFTLGGIATNTPSDEDADISPIVFEGLLRAIAPLITKMFRKPSVYGREAEELAVTESPQLASEVPNPGSSLGRPTRGILKNFERSVRQMGYEVKYVKSGPSRFEMQPNGKYCIFLNEETMTVGTLTDELSHAFANKHGIGTFLSKSERDFLLQLKQEARVKGGTHKLDPEKNLLLHMLELKNMINSGKELPAFYNMIEKYELDEFLAHTPGGLDISGNQIGG
jgi:hypothetical protein